MKKTALFMACCIGLLFFASCKKETQPTISIATGANYAGQGTELFADDPVTVGFSAIGEKLTKIEMNVSQNGMVIYTDAQSIENADTYLYVHSFTIDAVGTVTVSGIVTDAKGHTATTSFDILYYEKPNAKFVGRYEGNALITGSYDIEVTNMEPMHEDFENRPVAAIVEMAAADNSNEVVATVTIDEETSTMTGIVEGNKVIFEAINSSYNMTYQGFSLPIDMTYNIIGTLNEGRLELSGDCKGDGSINMLFITGTIQMEGTVGGSLDKTE